jgi:hypothetical protein
MAADAIKLFQGFKKRLGLAQFDFATDILKCALLTSAYVPNLATQEVYADLSGEVAGGNGYATGGAVLTGVVWAETGDDDMLLNANNVAWSATNVNLVARYAVLYDDTHPDKPLIGYILLDNTPADITVTPGNSLTLDFDDVGGIYRLN